MMGRTPLAIATSLGMILTGSAWAQNVISAHSGTIHYMEGQVELVGQPVQQDVQKGQFAEIKSGQTLTVKDGQAEVLLTPGVFLRVAENSSVTMLSNKLADTRIQVVSGTVMTEVGELLADNAITLKYQDAEISLGKRGLYRIDSDPARLRVYDGEARVTPAGGDMVSVRKGHELEFGAQLDAKSFDTKQTDAFYNWCARRDQYIAEANIYAAKSARDSGYGFTNASYSGLGGYGSGYGNSYGYGNGYGSGYGAYGNGVGSWMYNPYFGMFTYMPYSGMFYSPFGYSFFSPGMVGYMYMPGSPYYMAGGTSSGLGNNLVARNGSGLSPRSSSTPATPVTRSGFSAGSGSSGSSSSSVGGSPSRSSGVFGGTASSSGGHSAGGHK
jgi:hypothetical protein